MSELIDRGDVLGVISCFFEDSFIEDADVHCAELEREINRLPAAQRWVRCEEGCDLCRDDRLEKGDTLYQSSDWDGGIGFDYIGDIRFCPKCGRELTQWKPEPPKEDKR